MMFRKIACIMLMVLSLVVLVACGPCSHSENQGSIVGTWQMVYQTQVITYTFNENGSVIFHNEKSGETTEGKYTYRNNTLKMMGDGISEDAISVYLSGDVMVGYSLKQTLERQYYTESDSDANGIYGIWKSQLTDATWFIQKDNTISDLLGTYGFTQCGDIYVAHFIDDDVNTCPIAFTYENGKITLYLGPVMRKIK